MSISVKQYRDVKKLTPYRQKMLDFITITNRWIHMYTQALLLDIRNYYLVETAP